MKLTAKTGCLIIVFCVLVAGAFLFRWRISGEVEFANGIETGVTYSPIQLLNVHSSGLRYLSVHGHRYEGVRGSKPYYIELKDGKWLFFSCDEPGSPTVYHFYRMEGGVDVAIPANLNHFGRDLCAPKASTIRDYLVSEDLPNVSFCREFEGRKTAIKFNIDGKTASMDSQ